MSRREYAAVILAGGAGRRLGGAAKPTLPVAGRPMLSRVLAAVADAQMLVVVGPPTLAPMVAAAPGSGPPAGSGLVPAGRGGRRLTQERPPGGGPVAGLAAGLDRVTGDVPVLVLAADLPLLSPAAVAHLVRELGDHDGAVYVDGSGRRQWLCGVWRPAVLRRRLAELAATGPLVGRSLRELFEPLQIMDVVAAPGGPPPWYDCDTPEQLAAAEEAPGQPGAAC